MFFSTALLIALVVPGALAMPSAFPGTNVDSGARVTQRSVTPAVMVTQVGNIKDQADIIHQTLTSIAGVQPTNPGLVTTHNSVKSLFQEITPSTDPLDGLLGRCLSGDGNIDLLSDLLDSLNACGDPSDILDNILGGGLDSLVSGLLGGLLGDPVVNIVVSVLGSIPGLDSGCGCGTNVVTLLITLVGAVLNLVAGLLNLDGLGSQCSSATLSAVTSAVLPLLGGGL
ncbi:hypothetical protein DFH07DRAFT_32941 [Mycena maculata]|uniref:Uncharacterized protein n=1 Tax=Mycena maculata TaxID=230809 RepID=A0AAD7K2M5_9AGAR|nr:hypothetical protein DFH07DRAFT_32941 [Mycena maculata]